MNSQIRVGIIGVIVAVVVWWLVTYLNLVSPTLLASPNEVLKVLIEINKSNEGVTIYAHAFQTLKLALTGWLISVMLGSFVGAILGTYKKVYKYLEIILEFLRSVPPVLLFPLMLVMYNYGFKAYQYTIVLGTITIIILSVANGVEHLSKQKLELIKILKVKPLRSYFLKFMELLPSIVLSARITLSLALIIAVVTEMVFTPRSGLALGALARDAEINFDTPTFYAVIILLGVFGYLANHFLKYIEVKLKGQEQ